MNPIFLTVIQFFLVITIAPFAIGFTRWCKARLQNRRGASPFLPYWALASLCKKEMTVSRHTSWVFKFVPIAVLGSLLALTVLLPIYSTDSFFASFGNIFLVSALLAVGAAFLVLGGMDVASTFGNMGASREMTLAMLVEPVTLAVFLTFAQAAKSFSVSGIVDGFARMPLDHGQIFLLPTALAFIGVILAENARYPVDNPATHLELTMVHEAMVLEYSGPWLAMLEYASALKYTLLSVLLLNIVFPFALATTSSGITGLLFGALFVFGKVAIASFLVAILESTIAKMRFYRMQEYTATLYILSLLGFFLTVLFYN